MPSELNDARIYLVNPGADQLLAEELLDIKNCNVALVVKQITQKEIKILNQLCPFPTNSKNQVSITSARAAIQDFLERNPAFRSRSPRKVFQSLLYHFKRMRNENGEEFQQQITNAPIVEEVEDEISFESQDGNIGRFLTFQG